MVINLNGHEIPKFAGNPALPGYTSLHWENLIAALLNDPPSYKRMILEAYPNISEAC